MWVLHEGWTVWTYAHTHFDKCILTCQTLSDLILWQTAIVPFRNENK